MRNGAPLKVTGRRSTMGLAQGHSCFSFSLACVLVDGTNPVGQVSVTHRTGYSETVIQTRTGCCELESVVFSSNAVYPGRASNFLFVSGLHGTCGIDARSVVGAMVARMVALANSTSAAFAVILSEAIARYVGTACPGQSIKSRSHTSVLQYFYARYIESKDE